MATQTRPAAITYTKLRDGSWGLRGAGLVAGATVVVAKKSGETKTETIGRILWEGDGVQLASIGGVPTSRPARATRPPARAASRPAAPPPLTAEQIAAHATALGLTVVDGTIVGFTAYDKIGRTIGEIRPHKGRHYLVVAVGAPYYHSASECDDQDCFCGRHGWQTPYTTVPVTSPALQAEADAAAARVARATALEALLRASRVRSETDARLQPLPSGSVALWTDARMAGSETWYHAPDGTVWYCRSDYDSGPAVWQTTATPEHIAEAKSLGLTVGLL